MGIPNYSFCLACRAYAQILMQAMLQHFPSLLGSAAASPLAAAVAAFLGTSPSMKKLESIREAAFQEVLPGKARQPQNIIVKVPNVSCTTLPSMNIIQRRQ